MIQVSSPGFRMLHLPSLGGGLSLAAALLVAGCAGDSLPKLAVPSLPSPSWNAASTAAKPTREPQAVTAADMVNGEGQCAALEPTAAADAGPAATPAPAGTASLGMTECEVVRRVGQPLRVEIGNDERAERTVVVTYLQGVRPGIYRFRGGRLVSVERVPEQSTPKPEKKKPSKSKERAAAGT
jgi:hypothetical protein